MTARSNAEIKAIAEQYQRNFMKPLEQVIKAEFSGHMEEALLFIVQGAVNKPKRDAALIRETMAGMGTKDSLLLSRIVRAHWTPGYLALVQKEYKATFHRDLIADVKSETNGDFERLLVAML